MAEKIKPTKKREEMTVGEYKTLIDVGLDEIGNLIKRLIRSPEQPPYWYSAMVIALVTLLISFLTSLFNSEFYIYRDANGILSVLMQVWLVGIILLGTVVLKKYCVSFFSTL
ncbi:MAG: hypothetical protein GY865_14560, partial [candidate division Zixibacteria bacterium]|nr:hypothetical protein [candidate division Zixibacteria bacterium]